MAHSVFLNKGTATQNLGLRSPASVFLFISRLAPNTRMGDLPKVTSPTLKYSHKTHQEDKYHTSWTPKGVNSGNVPQAWDGPVSPSLIYSFYTKEVGKGISQSPACQQPGIPLLPKALNFTLSKPPLTQLWKRASHNDLLDLKWVWTRLHSSGAPCASRQDLSLHENPDLHTGRNRPISCWSSRLDLFG